MVGTMVGDKIMILQTFWAAWCRKSDRLSLPAWTPSVKTWASAHRDLICHMTNKVVVGFGVNAASLIWSKSPNLEMLQRRLILAKCKDGLVISADKWKGFVRHNIVLSLLISCSCKSSPPPIVISSLLRSNTVHEQLDKWTVNLADKFHRKAGYRANILLPSFLQKQQDGYNTSDKTEEVRFEKRYWIIIISAYCGDQSVVSLHASPRARCDW